MQKPEWNGYAWGKNSLTLRSLWMLIFNVCFIESLLYFCCYFTIVWNFGTSILDPSCSATGFLLCSFCFFGSLNWGKDSASAPKHLTCSTASRNLDQDHDDAETHGASGNDALRRRAETVAEFFLKACQNWGTCHVMPDFLVLFVDLDPLSQYRNWHITTIMIYS